MLEVRAALLLKNEIRGRVVRRRQSTGPRDRAEAPPSGPLAERDARTSGSRASAAPRAASTVRSCDTGSATPAAAGRRTAAPDAAASSSHLLTAASRARRTARRRIRGATSHAPQRRCASRTPGSAPQTSDAPEE